MSSTGHSSGTQLGPVALVDAVAGIAGVLADHAAALDRLSLGEHADASAHDPTGSSDPGARDPSGRGAGSALVEVLDHVAAGARHARHLGAVVDALRSGRDVADGDAGVGMAMVLAGLAEALTSADHLDATRFAIGLELAAGDLEAAEGQRAAGELPAVVAVAADAALAAADAGASLADTVVAAADDGLGELESGPTTNPRLEDRGVDAAAAGFLLVLDALASILTGEPLPSAPTTPAAPAAPAVAHRYRVRCEITPDPPADPERLAWLEDTCRELGELEHLAVDGDRWRLAAVSGVPGALVEALLDLGRPRELRIELSDGPGPGSRSMPA